MKNARIHFRCFPALMALFFLFAAIEYADINSASEQQSEKRPAVVTLQVEGVIGQATKNYVLRGIKYAERRGAQCLIINIDTPGGLMDSMKDIATAMINAKVPVVVYVYPNGGTATSAGFFILMASDIAAMAPDTSAGSAHPVSMGPEQMDETMKEKSTNYAAKYMEQLAVRRGRNANIAVKAVRRSISITSREAIEKNVVEIIASTPKELLSRLDGRTIVKGGQKNAVIDPKTADGVLLAALDKSDNGVSKTKDGKINIDLNSIPMEFKKLLKQKGYIKENGASYKINMKEVIVEKIDMSAREKFFQTIGHPNIAYILLMIGIYAMIFEVTHPGVIVPGVTGAVCLLLAFTAFQVIPINALGLVLIAAAFVLFLLELKLATHGLLAICGVASMVVGSVLLVDSPDPAMRVSFWVILSAVGTTSLFIFVAIAAIIATYKRKISTGREAMMGLSGKVIKSIAPTGKILVRGEIWNAVSESGEEIVEGADVIVAEMEGMLLKVKRS